MEQVSILDFAEKIIIQENIHPWVRYCMIKDGVKKYYPVYNVMDQEENSYLFYFWSRLNYPEFDIIAQTEYLFPKPPAKEYMYTCVWTYAPEYSIERVRRNIDLFVKRAKTLGLTYVDITYEEKSAKSERPHYNMRIKCNKMLPYNRFDNYTKYGIIKKQTLPEQKDWDNEGIYITKENPLEILYPLDMIKHK